MLDLDAGGTISETELKTGLEAVGKKMTDSQIHFMMSQVDANSNGEIDMAEVSARVCAARCRHGRCVTCAARPRKQFVEFLTYMRRGIIVTTPSRRSNDEKHADDEGEPRRKSASGEYLEKIAGSRTGNAEYDKQRLDEGLNQWAMLLGLGDDAESANGNTESAALANRAASASVAPIDVACDDARASKPSDDRAASRDKYGIPCLKMSEDPASTLDSLDSMLAGMYSSPTAATPNDGRQKLPPLAHPAATPPPANLSKPPDWGRTNKVHADEVEHG